MGTAMTNHDIELMGHLIRRAGFGATRDEIEQYAAHGYDATVDMLMDTGRPDGIQIDLIRRYHPDHSGGLGMSGFGAYWLHRMINSRTPLVEKVSLFWHGVFATGYSKLTQGKVLMDQIQMFRNHGFGDLRTLLIELSRDPSMIIWLDNNDNHNGAINENYGRELLELFSMGVGNYTEDDVKEASRAFTGWTIGNTEYMKLKADNDSLWPYGRLNLHFEFRDYDHDEGEITFLGHTGNFNGGDIVDIICDQQATARSSRGTCTASSWRMSLRCRRGRTRRHATPRPSTSCPRPTSRADAQSSPCSTPCSGLASSSRNLCGMRRSRVPPSSWRAFSG